MSILQVKNISKKIGKKEILKDITFEINKGDILAFIGPNGSGKTTTIKCILGLQKINTGEVIINGYDIRKDYIKAIEKVGCIVESLDVYMYLSGLENLKIQAAYYKNIKEEEITRVVKLVGLENKIYEKVCHYSLGMRQRLGIAIALINYPNLLILDEPTNGLDPKGIKDLRELLLKLAKQGTGILISSHNLSDLESLCTRVCILSNGRVIENVSISEIKQVNKNKYIIKTNNSDLIKNMLSEEDKILDKNYIEVIKEEEELAQFIKELVLKKAKIYEVKKEVLSLEEAFIKKAGDNIE